MATELFKKVPADVSDFKFDFNGVGNSAEDAESNWLASGETIASFTITADSGITVDSSSATDTNTSVTVWLSGGTVGSTYDIVCEITTDNATPRIWEETIQIEMVLSLNR